MYTAYWRDNTHFVIMNDDIQVVLVNFEDIYYRAKNKTTGANNHRALNDASTINEGCRLIIARIEAGRVIDWEKEVKDLEEDMCIFYKHFITI